MASGLLITHAELLDALAQASEAPEDARTVHEIAADTGMDQRRVREALKRLHDAGRLTVYRVPRTDLSGRVQMTPAYTVRPV